MRFSIIIPVFNAQRTIQDTLDSIVTQSYGDVEIIVIDGGSTDGTQKKIEGYRHLLANFISEPDRNIYDAINKGIKLATGDLIGILNADDFYVDKDVLQNVAYYFKNEKTDAVYADLEVVREQDTSKVVRYYSSKHFRPGRLRYGWMPAHPTLFIKREVFDSVGLYSTEYEIAGDYEFIVRAFWKHGISYHYFPKPIIRMRQGGLSNKNILSRIKLNSEVVRACKANGLHSNWLFILSKYPRKIMEYIR